MADAPHEDVAAKGAPWYARAWRAFNRWRRKYWLTRVLILLLIFGHAVSGRLGHFEVVPRLTGMAINAILRAAPTMEYHYYRYYKSCEANRLRCLLLHELHAGADGRLDAAGRQRAEALGLNVSQLEEPPPVPDLAPLADAAKALGLVPGTYSVQEARDEAFYAARARSEEFEAREYREAQSILDTCYDWPDYGKWETWQGGLSSFFDNILFVAPPLGVGIWLPLCFLGALGVSAQVRRRRLAGFAVGSGMGAGVYLLYFGIPESFWVALAGFALACSSGAVGLWAGGLALGIRRPRLAAAVCAVAGGATLVLSGILVTRTTNGYLWLALHLPPHPWWQYRSLRPDTESGVITVGMLFMLAGGLIAAYARWARWTSHGPGEPG